MTSIMNYIWRLILHDSEEQEKRTAMCYDVLEVCRHVINYSDEKDYGISNLKLQKIPGFVSVFLPWGK